MLKYASLFSVLLFFNCSYLQSEETNAIDSTNSIIDTMDASRPVIVPSDLDSFKITKLKEYAKDWDGSYFPLPTPAMLQHQPKKDPGYMYISNSFDSLSYKNSTDKEPSEGTPCSWKQKFKSGIIYNKSTCQESGTNYVINTKSNDKKTLIRLIDMLFYNPINDWNTDSTKYAPLSEKAGSYYSLEKNDAGYYDIVYSSSY
ncbi:hypothetical protein [Cytophaga aurantiaca]|uniref:hypothetical protein n=1 Tax=Cytophaga aurantiaca TaxID=29530 RepID=UPI000371A92D|nr:hypothetical protein [Cytophaga aurantiaca]